MSCGIEFWLQTSNRVLSNLVLAQIRNNNSLRYLGSAMLDFLPPGVMTMLISHQMPSPGSLGSSDI